MSSGLNNSAPTGENAAGQRKKGFMIGPVEIENPFVLAPLAGLTNWPFRRLAKEAGAGLTVTEMVSSVALSFNGQATIKMLTTDKNIERPFCVQLFGKDPERMAIGAKVAVDHGADIIDINMGCPARKVISSGHGSALLKDYDQIRRILKAVVGAVNIPVTVKTRPGFAPGVGSVFEILPILEGEGAAAITLHPRLTSEGFSGRADWSIVAELAARAAVPVIGSGDITTAGEAVERLENYGAAAVMIGRGAKGRPWLFRQCLERWRGEEESPVTVLERLDTAQRHARHLEAQMGPKVAYMMRSVLMWYSKGLPGSSEFRVRICREESLDRQLEMMWEYFGHLSDSDQDDSPDMSVESDDALNAALE